MEIIKTPILRFMGFEDFGELVCSIFGIGILGLMKVN